jgi:shikimate-5-dehydrogenase
MDECLCRSAAITDRVRLEINGKSPSEGAKLTSLPCREPNMVICPENKSYGACCDNIEIIIFYLEIIWSRTPASLSLTTFTMAEESLSTSATDATIKQYHIFGRGISFSMSPAIHNTGFKHHNLSSNYSITEVDVVDECLPFISREEFSGASVTMPYKLEVAQYCDILSDEAKLLGAVNTLAVGRGANGQRTIEGDNTDWSGILNCIRTTYPDLSSPPKTGWVIGAGGAARAAIYALHRVGVESIFISNRSRSKAEAIAHTFASQFSVEVMDDWAEMNAHPADVIVGTVPADTYTDAQFDGLEWNTAGGLCLDMSYKPRVTPLLSFAAKAPQWTTANGIEILLEQGYVQYQKWTGLEPPKQLMRVAVGCDPAPGSCDDKSKQNRL